MDGGRTRGPLLIVLAELDFGFGGVPANSKKQSDSRPQGSWHIIGFTWDIK